MQKCRDMRWSGKKYVRRYHKSLNIAKALEKKVTGENYVWYSVRALHVTLLVLLFSLFIFSFISPLIWVGLGWNFHRWFSIHQQVKWERVAINRTIDINLSSMGNCVLRKLAINPNSLWNRAQKSGLCYRLWALLDSPLIRRHFVVVDAVVRRITVIAVDFGQGFRDHDGSWGRP